MENLVSNELLKYEESLSKCVTSRERKKLVEQKNILLRNEIDRQLKENGIFHIDIPLSNPCKKCNGYGEQYQFKTPIEIDCSACKGTGKKKFTCVKCKGIGKIQTTFKGLTINNNCDKCEGKGTTEKKCLSCNGKGKIKRLISSKKIVKHNECQKCQGTGLEQLKSQHLMTPVLSDAIAKLLIKKG